MELGNSLGRNAQWYLVSECGPQMISQVWGKEMVFEVMGVDDNIYGKNAV